MGGNRTPGPQGLNAGGTAFAAAGTARKAACIRRPTNGNSFVKQKQSWCLGRHQVPEHDKIVGQIYFATNSARLDSKDRESLDNLCGAIVASGCPRGEGAALFLVGEADHRGDPGYNWRLAAYRALAVKQYLKTKLPAAIIVGKSLGEMKATQPDQCGHVSQQRMAEERVVMIIYAKYRIIIGDDLEIMPPKIDDVIEDARRIVQANKAKLGNPGKRLLCYLTKLKPRPTAENDGYWTYGDWEAGWKAAYKSGKYRKEDAASFLRKARRSARNFLKLEVALRRTDQQKLEQLLLLDRTIFNSVQKVADRLRRSGSEKCFAYWIAIKNTLFDMMENELTLYHCIESETKSIWEYIPV
jgi:outer membrane protein OmpA-like peptidoglycan-associated protein